MNKVLLLIIPLIGFGFGSPLLSKLPDTIYNIEEFGAKNDSSFLSTKAIQKAIDQCHHDGGGKVIIPPGQYKTGTIILKSRVILDFSPGATLYASLDPEDIKMTAELDSTGKRTPKGNGARQALIYAQGAQHIGITGKGVIDGRARRIYEPLKTVDRFIAGLTEAAEASGVEMKRWYKIPPLTNLIIFESCEDVTIRDITLRESSMWTLHMMWCKRIFIDNIYLYSDLEKGVNADGIDIDGCQDVMITNSEVITGDDAIVLKTTGTDGVSQPCENITVSNCVLSSTSAALKLGTESHNDFSFITFSNCVIRNTNRGLSIVIRDGGTAENILFSNIVLETDRKHFNWWGNGDPIWLVLLKRHPHSRLGMIRNIVFENIIAHGQGTSIIEGFPPQEGYPNGRHLENIQLNNVQFFMEAEDYPDKRATHGFEARYINGLKISNSSFSWDEQQSEPKWASAIALDHVSSLNISDIELMPGKIKDTVPAIHLKNVAKAYLKYIRATAPIPLMIKLEGQNSKDIFVDRIDPDHKAKRVFDIPQNLSSSIKKVE